MQKDAGTEWEAVEMGRTMYKCFLCGKVYDEEERALKCHNAPIQEIVKNEGQAKPRFLGR